MQINNEIAKSPLKSVIGSWTVHAFTTTGTICALAACISILDSRPKLAIAWLLVAQIIDGLDGIFARKQAVTKHTPVVDGNILDLVIDYMTCVSVPVLFAIKFNLYSNTVNVIICSLILCSSAIWFSRKDIETNDMWFRGFPAGWNMVITVFWLMETTQTVNLIASLILVVLTLTPQIKFFHILSSSQYRIITVTLSSIQIATIFFMVFVAHEQHNKIGKLILVLWTIYFFIMSAWRTSKGDEITN